MDSEVEIERILKESDKNGACVCVCVLGGGGACRAAPVQQRAQAGQVPLSRRAGTACSLPLVCVPPSPRSVLVSLQVTARSTTTSLWSS